MFLCPGFSTQTAHCAMVSEEKRGLVAVFFRERSHQGQHRRKIGILSSVDMVAKPELAQEKNSQIGQHKSP